MSVWEMLKKESYPKDTCLCGLFPSLSRILESIKEEYETTNVEVTRDYIIVYSKYVPPKPYRYEVIGEELNRIYIPNPARDYIVIYDLNCCGLPKCLCLLFDILFDINS